MTQAYCHCVVLITAPNSISAEIAKKLVKKADVACVNLVSNVTSVFVWQGEIAEESEDLLIAKTRPEFVEQIIEDVTQWHTYEVPEIISIPISTGHTDYLNWIDTALSRRAKDP